MEFMGPGKEKALGELLKDIAKKAKPSKKKLQGRTLAQQVFEREFAAYSKHARVAALKTGVVVLETDSAPVFQELEGFKKQDILKKLREAGLQAAEVRVQLAKH